MVGRDGRQVRRLAVKAGASGVVALFGVDYVGDEDLYVGDGADSLTNPNSRNTRVLRINPDTGEARVRATGVGGPIGVLRHGRWLYVADGVNGRVLRMRPDRGCSSGHGAESSAAAGSRVPHGANGVAVDPAGRNLYAAP